MFALGHLGLGKKLATRPYRRFSPVEKRAFFAGALLPDLIDKPLFYIPFWITGRRAWMLSGTHLFGHTGLFLVVLVATAFFMRVDGAGLCPAESSREVRGTLPGFLSDRSLVVRALSIGVTTHFILDFVGLSMDVRTLLWPLFGWHFPTYPFRSVGQHLWTVLNPVTLTGELLGAAILLWDYRKARRRAAE